MAASHYSEATAAALCERVAKGHALSAAARACGLSPSTVHGWYHRHAAFRTRLDAARERATGLTGKTVRPVGSSTSGRPAKYRPETANEIAERHGAGEQLIDIAQAVGVGYGTILNWIGQHPEFRDMMAEARRSYAHAAVDQALRIADDDSGDLIEQPDRRITANTVRVKRDQLRVQTRWRTAAAFNPEAYGERKSGPGGVQVNITLNAEDRASLERYIELADSIPGEPIDD